jgi:hypothetical protein
MARNHPGLTYVLIGCTARFKTHAVLARDDRIIHDPATSAGDTVLTRQCNDGFTRVGFLALAL